VLKQRCGDFGQWLPQPAPTPTVTTDTSRRHWDAHAISKPTPRPPVHLIGEGIVAANFGDRIVYSIDPAYLRRAVDCTQGVAVEAAEPQPSSGWDRAKSRVRTAWRWLNERKQQILQIPWLKNGTIGALALLAAVILYRQANKVTWTDNRGDD
jgi:hypothetical protein